MDQPTDTAPQEERPPRQEPRSLQSSNWRTPGSAPTPTKSSSSRTDQQARSSPRPHGGQSQGQTQGQDQREKGEKGDKADRDARPQRGQVSRSVDNWRSAAASPPAQSPSRSNQGYNRDRTQNNWKREKDAAAPPTTSSHNTPSRTGNNSSSNNGAPAEESAALAEGRRIYLGNILYHVRPDEIAQTLDKEGLTDYEQIHISIDPVSGRNPGYCFVEFETKESADKAIEQLNGVQVHGRPLKTGPCNPKTSRGPRRDGGNGAGAGAKKEEGYKPTFNRWGDSSAGKNGARPRRDGPDAAREHLSETLSGEQRSRLYVGGLGKMVNQAQNDEEMRALFDGFKVKAIGKRITAHASTREAPGNHNYCFIDFESPDEASKAAKKLNGFEYQGTNLKVNVAKKQAPRTVEHSAAVHDVTAEFWGRPEPGDRP